jgi:hypothetical protein
MVLHDYIVIGFFFSGEGFNMIDISPYMIDQITKAIDTKISERLIKYLYLEKSPNISEEVWLNDYVLVILESNIGDGDISEERIKLRGMKDNAFRKRQQGKKYWLQSFHEDILKNSDNSLDYEMTFLERNLEQLSDRNRDFKKETYLFDYYGIRSLEEYRTQRIKEIEDWAVNKTSNLTDYTYLKDKPFSSIKKAFENDMTYVIAQIIYNNYDGSLKNSITIQPHVLVEHPIFGNSSMTLKTNFEKDTETEQSFLYSDYVVDDYLLQTVIPLREGDTLVRKDKALDEGDNTMVNLILNKRDEEFYTNRTIRVDLGELANSVYSTRGGKSHELIEKRLDKISTYKFRAVIKKSTRERKEKDDWINFSIFDRVHVQTEDGKRIAVIFVADTLYQQILNMQTVQIYSDLIKKLENPMSRLLIFALQKERLDRHIQGLPFTDIYKYLYFSQKVRFKGKKMDVNMELIELALDEFRSHNILIEDFQRSHNSFRITFTPLSNFELHDFFDKEKSLN